MYTPGVFTQQIVPPTYNDSVMYMLETVDGVAAWKGVVVSGDFPVRREGASVTIGNGVVYVIGGRTTNEYVCMCAAWLKAFSFSWTWNFRNMLFLTSSARLIQVEPKQTVCILEYAPLLCNLNTLSASTYILTHFTCTLFPIQSIKQVLNGFHNFFFSY